MPVVHPSPRTMLPLYLFCLVVGGGLLAFSLFGAEGHDAGGGEVGADAGHAGPSPPEGDGDAHEFFSLRVLTYLLAGFGATGALLETLTAASGAVGAIWAAATGVVAATGAAALFGWLKRSESGLVPLGADHLVGLAGQVLLAVGPERHGKVLVVSAGREVELLARPFGPEDSPCPRGSRVVIVDMEGAVALVTPLPALPPDLS